MVGETHEDLIKWCAGGLYAGAGDTVCPDPAYLIITLFHVYPLDGFSHSFLHPPNGRPPTSSKQDSDRAS